MSHPFPPGSRVFAYLRDSGHEDQDLSIPQQEAALRAWAAENGLILSHIYTDEARRGSSVIGRDALQEMMNAVRRGCPERGVVVWKYNRFARNVDNAIFYRSEIRSHGYIFHSLNDSVPPGPEGRVFEALIDYKDAQYLIDLSIDVKRGLRDLVSNHGCMPGVPPRGFMREPVDIGARRDGAPHVAHRWIPDPDLVPTVRQVFEMRAAGASLGAIQKATHLYGSINSYATCFSNQLYIGRLQFGDLLIENYCDPIISRPVWDAVQARQNRFAHRRHLQSGSPDHPRRAASRFLLSGLARCARCGSPLFGHSSIQRSGARIDSYFCSRAPRNRDCTRHRIPRLPFETAVIATLKDYILKPETLTAVCSRLNADQADRLAEQDRQRRDLGARLGVLRRQIRHVTDSIADLGGSRSLLDRLRDLETQETDLLSQQAALETQAEQPVGEIPPDQLTAAIQQFDAAFSTASIDDQRTILRGFIDHIDVDRDGNLLTGVIYYYYPPPANNSPHPDAVSTSPNTPGAPLF